MNTIRGWSPPAWWKDFKVHKPATLSGLWKLPGPSGQMVYRGLSDAKYNLSPRVARKTAHVENEWNMMFEFLSYARSHGYELGDKLELLALAQHHGLPTRCMDVTSAFGVALYFASSGKLTPRGAAIWCLDLKEMPYVAINWYRRYRKGVPDDLTCDYQIFPNLPKIAGRHIVPMNIRDQIDREIDDYMTYPETPPYPPRHPPILVAPPHISRRITAQDGNFAVIDPNGGHLAKQLKTLRCQNALTGIWLSPKLVAEVRAHLKVLGVSRRLLFPDIDNLALDITDRYSVSDA